MKKAIVVAILLAAIAYGCPSISPEMRMAEPGYRIMGVSEDPTYGYGESNPVKVGGALERGPKNEHDYLYALRGPAGEMLYFTRLGSCCPFSTPNGIEGTGLLDKYQVSHPGLDEPVILYINMYDYEDPLAPMGFTYVDYGI